MRMLVLGGRGLLGGELLSQARAQEIEAIGTSTLATTPSGGSAWRQLDLRDRQATIELIQATRADVVINVAYRQSDWATTADGAANAAVATSAAGAHLVFVSSDAVFSGARSPYSERALPDPLTPYGAAKAAAETAVRAVAAESTIVRTSLIISSNGASVHERRTHAAARGKEQLFTDDVRCPVHVEDLAGAILELASARRSGMHHLAGPEAMSRYDLGRLIALRDGLDPSRIPASQRARSSMPGPLDVRLDSQATQRRIGTRLRGPSSFLTTSG
ncbi:dTDP-4-dehydrorhamnose reductase [Frigoribacterium sp. PhB160]|uniref:sugar nucleotide-binding protein n=1 Tax=Frigoribacterium sp. PhB160 TaxID=2485192 RepID=UPI000F47EB2E|nr:sugar nucleotide-binding protein [Frigoribacterium sp. PhB160]ROS61197.1 dTDP-4-dehydrorhamnose reductase [Frigoribacterium sp. PhB160]